MNLLAFAGVAAGLWFLVTILGLLAGVVLALAIEPRWSVYVLAGVVVFVCVCAGWYNVAILAGVGLLAYGKAKGRRR